MSAAQDLSAPGDASLLKRLAPKGGRAEIAAAGIVVAIVLAMLLPLPPWLLDIFIALNISTSALLIVLVMQVKDSVGISSFPSLVLVTTLFRVALSVASTRLILLEGEAGHIIEAFGEVVVGGNLVVGLVVFFILTVVQFLVITKGAERVAEVGARFALDAMPGKQLAIDIELKSNAITPEQATLKRATLGQESQFFGAMDGAMKFVKGDAIAGIVIVLTNLIGGLTIGVLQRGMTGAEALHTYSILTIGDGLVAQVPALLMSLTAGLLVTRVANAEAGSRNIGKEITAQLMAQPKSWVTAGFAIAAFGLLPGMPVLVFMSFAGGAMAIGLVAIRKAMTEDATAAGELVKNVPELREFSPVRPFLVRVGAHVDEARSTSVLNLARHARNELVVEYGMVTPAIEVEAAPQLSDADFEFCHDEVRVFAMRFHEQLVTALCEPRQAQALGLPAELIEERAGWAGYSRVWLTPEQAAALTPPLRTQTFAEHLRSQVRSALFRAGPRYFGIEQAQKLIKWVSTRSPDLCKELERAVPLNRFAEVFQRLLSERVSIRNVNVIIDSLVEWGQRERDAAVLNECVRAALSREICDAYAVGGELHAAMLEAELENTLRGAVRQTTYGDFLALDVGVTDALGDELASALGTAPEGRSPVVLCASDLRPHVRRFLRDRFDEVAVLALSEVPGNCRVKVLTVLRGIPAPAEISAAAS
jgi:type III secretion protein V